MTTGTVTLSGAAIATIAALTLSLNGVLARLDKLELQVIHAVRGDGVGLNRPTQTAIDTRRGDASIASVSVHVKDITGPIVLRLAPINVDQRTQGGFEEGRIHAQSGRVTIGIGFYREQKSKRVCLGNTKCDVDPGNTSIEFPPSMLSAVDDNPVLGAVTYSVELKNTAGGNSKAWLVSSCLVATGSLRAQQPD